MFWQSLTCHPSPSWDSLPLFCFYGILVVFCVCMRCLLKEELWENNVPNDPLFFVGSWPRAPVRHAWSQLSLKLIITQRWEERFPYSQSCAICIWPLISQILLSCFQVVSLFIAGFSSFLSTECNLWCEKLLFGKVCLISSALKHSAQHCTATLSTTHRGCARNAGD